MASVIKKLPHYTVEDYLHWEGRWELIEGLPFAMSPAPIPNHQKVNARLWSIFDNSLKKHCAKCEAYIPIDWRISDDTVVQPDLTIVCKKITKKYLDFIPSLVLEILSPSTAYKDRHEKFELYEQQRVKYYVIVDPQFKKIEIYRLIDNKYQPVSISPSDYEFDLDDDCKLPINFAETWD